MRIWNLHFTKQILINTKKYKIDWNKAPSKEQQVLQDFLCPLWKNKVVLREVRIPSSLLRLDLVCVTNRIVIEYSPISHHNNFNEFFHKNRVNYINSINRDLKKLKWMEDPRNDLKYIELNEEDLDYFCPDYIYDKFGVNIV